MLIINVKMNQLVELKRLISFAKETNRLGEPELKFTG